MASSPRTAAAIINTGWLGYARVDYRTGEDIEGWSVNAGLRYQFTPEQRAAASKMGRRRPALLQLDRRLPGRLRRHGMGRPGLVHERDQHQDDPRFQGYLFGGQAATTSRPAGSSTASRPTTVGRMPRARGPAREGRARSSSPARPRWTAWLADRPHRPHLGRALFYVKGGLAAGEATVQTSPQPGYCRSRRPTRRSTARASGCLAGPSVPAWSSP